VYRSWLIIAAAALAVLLAGCTKPGGSWGNAPDFTYAAADGTQAKLSSHAGKVVVVNFWAVW
jgi:hypothetical protein